MSDFDDVLQVLHTYFDGLHHSDIARLRRVFHPEAHYFCATSGELLHLDMAQYFPLVDKRPAPALLGQPRTDKVLSIEFAGPVTALARVQCSIAPKHFTDLLSLIKLEGRWQIISKVFHYESTPS